MRQFTVGRIAAIAGTLCLALALGCGGEPNYERGTEAPPDSAERVNKLVASITTDAAATPAPARRLNCQLLAKYGKAAESALPALEQVAAQDPDESVRTSAAEAIKAIKGGGAPPAQ